MNAVNEYREDGIKFIAVYAVTTDDEKTSEERVEFRNAYRQDADKYAREMSQGGEHWRLVTAA
jgi:hypothetical protein